MRFAPNWWSLLNHFKKVEKLNMNFWFVLTAFMSGEFAIAFQILTLRMRSKERIPCKANWNQTPKIFSHISFKEMRPIFVSRSPVLIVSVFFRGRKLPGPFLTVTLFRKRAASGPEGFPGRRCPGIFPRKRQR